MGRGMKVLLSKEIPSWTKWAVFSIWLFILLLWLSGYSAYFGF